MTPSFFRDRAIAGDCSHGGSEELLAIFYSLVMKVSESITRSMHIQSTSLCVFQLTS